MSENKMKGVYAVNSDIFAEEEMWLIDVDEQSLEKFSEFDTITELFNQYFLFQGKGSHLWFVFINRYTVETSDHKLAELIETRVKEIGDGIVNSIKGCDPEHADSIRERVWNISWYWRCG